MVIDKLYMWPTNATIFRIIFLSIDSFLLFYEFTTILQISAIEHNGEMKNNKWRFFILFNKHRHPAALSRILKLDHKLKWLFTIAANQSICRSVLRIQYLSKIHAGYSLFFVGKNQLWLRYVPVALCTQSCCNNCMNEHFIMFSKRND